MAKETTLVDVWPCGEGLRAGELHICMQAIGATCARVFEPGWGITSIRSEPGKNGVLAVLFTVRGEMKPGAEDLTGAIIRKGVSNA